MTYLCTGAGMAFLVNSISSELPMRFQREVWSKPSGSWAVFASLPDQSSIHLDPARNLTGGMYSEGELGPLKVTEHISYTTAMAAWSLMRGGLCVGGGRGCGAEAGAMTLLLEGARFLSNACAPLLSLSQLASKYSLTSNTNGSTAA